MNKGIVKCVKLTQESINNILKESIENIPELKAVVIVSYEGIPIASILPEDVNNVEIAALTASILLLAERAIVLLNTGYLEQICIQCSDL